MQIEITCITNIDIYHQNLKRSASNLSVLYLKLFIRDFFKQILLIVCRTLCF